MFHVYYFPNEMAGKFPQGKTHHSVLQAGWFRVQLSSGKRTVKTLAGIAMPLKGSACAPRHAGTTPLGRALCWGQASSGAPKLSSMNPTPTAERFPLYVPAAEHLQPGMVMVVHG